MKYIAMLILALMTSISYGQEIVEITNAEAKQAKQLQDGEEVRIPVPFYTVNHGIKNTTEFPQFLTRRGDFKRLKQITGNGKGIKVGVVDTGLDPTHARVGGDLEIYNGRNPNTYRVREARDFTNSRSGWADINSHGCIHGEDMIYTSKNGVQKIKDLFEEIDSGDFPIVPSEEGSLIYDISQLYLNTISLSMEDGSTGQDQVTHIHKLQHTGKLYKISVGSEVLSLTPWHPVYVQTSARGKDRTIRKIRADELKVGDRICKPHGFNQVSEGTYTFVTDSDFQCENCGKMYKSDYSRCKACKKSTSRTEINNEFELDENLAMLVGLILTDGYIAKDSIEFTSSNDLHIELFNELHEKVFSEGTKEYATDNENSRRVRSHNRHLRNILKQMGYGPGAKSLTCHIPKQIQTSPRSVILSFFAGAIEGDGCCSSGRVRLITASDQMKSDCMYLLNSIGINTSASFVKPNDKSTFGGAGTWHLNISKSAEINEKLRVKSFNPSFREGIKSKSIKSIQIEDYCGDLYDFTVKNNHNYVCNGYIVSNTHVAGHIGAKGDGRGIEGIASDCELYVAKGLGDGGFGSDSQIANAIEWLISKEVDIINLSLGGGYSPRIEAAVKKANEAGIIVFAAMGNSGPSENTGGHPGTSKYTYAITAVNYDKVIARFSSRSRMAISCGYGVNVMSCVRNGRYAALSGTSMATPDQVGLCALILSYCRLKGVEIKNTKDYIALVKTSYEDLGRAGWDTAYGQGFIDVWGVVKYIDDNVGGNPPPVDPDKPTDPVDPYKGYKEYGRGTINGSRFILLKELLQNSQQECEECKNTEELITGPEFLELMSGVTK